MAQQEPLEFSVVGPGGKMKVYVGPEGGGQAQVATDAAANGAIWGAMGGWRRIQEQQGPVVQQLVPVLPYEPQIVQLFYQLEPQVALEQVPFDNPTSKEVLTYTLGYWEESTGTGQDELYPACVLQARYEGVVTPTVGVTETVVVTDYTYIPANETYMRPLAKIASHSDLSRSFWPGQVITFTAADASKPLAELGYHESLTFTLGSGGPYIYNWYRGSVAGENWIGAGRQLTYTVTLAGEAGHEVPVPQNIILVVTDAGSDHAAQNTSSDSTQLTIVPPVFLPLVLKNFSS